MANLKNVEALKDAFIANAKSSSPLPYANITKKGKNYTYDGWVTNFHIYEKGKSTPVSLNLKADKNTEEFEKDLFLLFVLAASWSKSGFYENAAYFAAYLKHKGWDEPSQWMDDHFVDERNEENKTGADVESLPKIFEMSSREPIAFRYDFYLSIPILAKNWKKIKESLKKSEEKKDYFIFIRCIREIKGLGAGNDRMRIKIPLILRELRIADAYDDIPGEWCCVPDVRVLKACKNPSLGIKFGLGRKALTYGIKIDKQSEEKGITGDLKTVLNQSQMIYLLFDNLYDVPLFAYKDLHDKKVISF